MRRRRAVSILNSLGGRINPCGKMLPVDCIRHSSEAPVMSPPERLNTDSMTATSPLIRGVFYWTLTKSYAGPYQIGSVEWPVRAGDEPVVVALDGQRFRIDDCIAQLICDDPQQRLYAACF